MSKTVYEIIINLTEELQVKDKEVNTLKALINKISARKENLEKQITEREILLDDMAKAINERDIKNHKLERENEGYKELSRLIDLNEAICIKYKAKYNKARTITKQNRQAIRELLQDIDNYEFLNRDGKKFRDGDVKAFVELLDGRCEMFNEEQCKLLLNQ